MEKLKKLALSGFLIALLFGCHKNYRVKLPNNDTVTVIVWESDPKDYQWIRSNNTFLVKVMKVDKEANWSLSHQFIPTSQNNIDTVMIQGETVLIAWGTIIPKM